MSEHKKNPLPNVMPTTEPEKSQLETKLMADRARIKEGMKRIKELFKIPYVPGKENRVGLFPILEQLKDGPLARFSYGKDAPNMSTIHFDSDAGESSITGEKNTNEFLEKNGFGTKFVIQTIGKFEGNEPQIEEVDRFTLEDKSKTVGNVIFTRDPEVTLVIKPADCPVGVLYCKDKEGNPIVAIIHGGAESLNAGLIRDGLQALQIQLEVDLSTAVLAIFPGMKDYNISRFYKDLNDGEIKRRYDGLYPINLGEYIAKPQTDDPLERLVVDLMSIYEMQAQQAGVLPENIEAIRVDTFEDAKNGIAFSQRLAVDHGGRKGRNLIAVQIPRIRKEENTTELLVAA